MSLFEKMKFKKGDKVRVKNDLSTKKLYNGIGFVPDMKCFLGKEVIIRKVIKKRDYECYNVEADQYDWNFTEDMIEGEYTQLKIE